MRIIDGMSDGCSSDLLLHVRFQLPRALTHAAHRVCATCPQKLRPCAPRPLLCALAPTLRRGVDRSSSTRFRAGCGLEGPQLPLRSMRSQVDCAALPDLRRAMWPLRPCLRPRSEEHTSDLPSLMRISYAGFCLIKKKNTHT